jgi:DNA-binding NarL/FixJ family response regulator
LQPIRKEGIVIRVFLVCDDHFFCNRVRDFLNHQDDFQVCGETKLDVTSLQVARKSLPDVGILVVGDTHDLGFADVVKRVMPDLPLFLMTRTLNLEIEKKALSHGVDAVFSADDDLMALASNARGICHQRMPL